MAFRLTRVVVQSAQTSIRWKSRVAKNNKSNVYKIWSQKWREQQRDENPLYEGRLPGTTIVAPSNLQERVAQLVTLMKHYNVDAHTASGYFCSCRLYFICLNFAILYRMMDHQRVCELKTPLPTNSSKKVTFHENNRRKSIK